ncbi:hypothetical protein [Nonomuraea typhae]|uniref:Uncharacterized protein n=1 Tax=Nonomuraea typhae TaxID=2603600 RepID=A0ABW7YX84_9ACTN
MHDDQSNETKTDLYALRLDESLFTDVEGTTLAFAPIDDAEDAFAVRDVSNLDVGTLRMPGNALRSSPWPSDSQLRRNQPTRARRGGRASTPRGSPPHREGTNMHRWKPYVPDGALLCVVEASCCEEYVVCSESGVYFVRRRAVGRIYEETARGPFLRASKAWTELSASHQHQRKAAS